MTESVDELKQKIANLEQIIKDQEAKISKLESEQSVFDLKSIIEALPKGTDE